MRAKDAVGAYGERVAADFLRDAGLTLLERNWRCPDGEIDLIAADGDVLVFCEVKTRSGLGFGYPAEAVVGAKAARIRRLATRWLATHESHWAEIRFDVISVLRQSRGAGSVTHLRGAF